MASPITGKIGSGITFPLKLTTLKDAKGKDVMVPQVDSKGAVTMVPAVGCYPVVGDPKLISNNLTALFTYQLGERFRQENFGSRLWEAIEEPNDQVLQHMINLFIKSSVAKWEPRIKALDVVLEKNKEKLYITLKFMVESSGNVENLTLEYNSITTSTNAY